MSAVATPGPPRLACRLEAVPPLRAGGPVALRFQLTNRTAAPVWVLRWNTPFEEWRGTILRVHFAGRELDYQGRRVKRGEPTAEEYLEIAAGESKSVTRDLNPAYDVSRPGTYTVEVAEGLQDVLQGGSPPRPRDRFAPLALACEALTLKVEK